MKLKSLIAACALFTAGSASAVTVHWARLTGAGANSVTGHITIGATNIGLTFLGDYSFAQLNGVGTNYYTEGTPAPYTSGVVSNAPDTSDLIALNAGGLKTVVFSNAVTDVYLALVSWNSNTFTNTHPITTISSGCGYWGCGGFSNVTSTGFDTTGELHGMIRFDGSTHSINFNDANDEYWHGFAIGIAAAVPEPAQWALMIGGFGLVGAAARRRRSALVAA